MVRKWAWMGCLTLVVAPVGCSGKKEEIASNSGASAPDSGSSSTQGSQSGSGTQSAPSGGSESSTSSAKAPPTSSSGSAPVASGSGKPSVSGPGMGGGGSTASSGAGNATEGESAPPGGSSRPSVAGGSSRPSVSGGSSRPAVVGPGGSSSGSNSGGGAMMAEGGGTGGGAMMAEGGGTGGAMMSDGPSAPAPGNGLASGSGGVSSAASNLVSAPAKLTFKDRAQIAFQAGNTKRAYQLLLAHGLTGNEEDSSEVANDFRWAPKAKMPKVGLNIAVGLVLKNPANLTDMKPVGTDLQTITAGTTVANGRGGAGAAGGPGARGPGFGGPGGSSAGTSVASGVKARQLADAAGTLAEEMINALEEHHSKGDWGTAFKDSSLSSSSADLNRLVGTGGNAGFFGAGGGGGTQSEGAPAAGGPPAGYSGGGGPPAGYAGGGGPPAGYTGGGGPPAGYTGGGGPPAGYTGGGGPPAGYTGGGGPPAGYSGGGGPPPGYKGGNSSGGPPGYGGGSGGPPAGYNGGGGGSKPPGSNSSFWFPQGTETEGGGGPVAPPATGFGGSNRPGLAGGGGRPSAGGPGSSGGANNGAMGFNPPTRLGPDMKLPEGVIPLAACADYIGSGEASKLITQAYEDGYDALVLFEVEVSQNRKTRVVNNSVRVRAVIPAENPKEARSIATSSVLENVAVARANSKSEDDKVSDAAKHVAKKLADEIGMKEIPDKLTPSIIVESRFPQLLKDQSLSVLDKLGEVNYYFEKGYIDEVTRDDYFEKVGGNNVKPLLSTTKKMLEQREDMLEKLLDN